MVTNHYFLVLMSIILGIDPGSRKTGYGIIESVGGKPHYIASGCIRLTSETGLPARLTSLFTSLQTLIDDYHPVDVAVEQVFVGKSAGSALTLGHARGVALLVPSMAGLDVFEYAARSVKQAVAGTGAADKAQVQSMVVRLLKLNATPGEDAADALAVALCHMYSVKLSRLVQTRGETAS